MASTSAPTAEAAPTRFPCGHTHTFSLLTKPDELGGGADDITMVLESDGCEEAAAWGESLWALVGARIKQLEAQVKKLDAEVERAARRGATHFHDLEVAFGLIREFSGLYRDAEQRCARAERELAVFRHTCDCWRRPDQVCRRAPHLH
ncbi:hypothetical protein C8Q78DRAFT_1042301 [Trametes maxima]|nr:hypothetical protein C8Q78DRAFT_1042301 [Trametes maxima]